MQRRRNKGDEEVRVAPGEGQRAVLGYEIRDDCGNRSDLMRVEVV